MASRRPMGFVESREGMREALSLEVLNPDVNVGILGRDDPFIVGVEITQGIQYYRASRHLTDEHDRGPDNSVLHVAGKPAWVRVYVHSGLFSAGETVTGRLDIERRRAGGAFRPVGSTHPVGAGAVTVERQGYDDERSAIASTLNFILSAPVMTGVLRLTITIWRSDDPTKAPVDSFTTKCGAVLVQTLSLRGIFVRYDGPPSLNPPPGTPDLHLPAPGLADLQATAAWALTTFPVRSTAVFSSAGTMAWGTPLTGPMTSLGKCSTQWKDLNAAIAEVKANDGNRSDVIYYGLLNSGTPIANVGGCESSGVSAGPDGNQITMAHEVGHGAGLHHAPCGSVGDSADDAYPAYEPYDPTDTPTASIGEYGLDINTGAIHDPTSKDFMSYCKANPPWISLYHYRRLINVDKFSPTHVGVETDDTQQLADPNLWPWEYLPDPPPWERGPVDVAMRPNPLISIIGIVDEVGAIEIVSVMRVNALSSISGALTDLIAELVGADGAVLARARVIRLASQAGGCGCAGKPDDEAHDPYLIQALVDDVEAGSALLIRSLRSETLADDDKAPLWRREAPGEAPSVHDVTAVADDDAVHLRWSTNAAADTERLLSHSIQVTKDDGKSWNSVAVRVASEAVDLSMDGLPSGDLKFRVLAHDGFQTASAISDAIPIPARPPIATILHPMDGRPIPAGGVMRLHAAITSPQGGVDDHATIEWRIDGEPVGSGPDDFVETPSPGEHRVELLVEDPGGRVVEVARLLVIDDASGAD